MPANPYEKYKQQSVMTMTQGEMLLLLYDETIKQINLGARAIDNGETDKANAALQKAQRIINYLSATLDHKYEISSSLSSLYSYFVQRLINANIQKDTEPLNEILPMVTDLRATFAQAEKQAKSGTAQAPTVAAQNTPAVHPGV